jgi:hypothetical protein
MRGEADLTLGDVVRRIREEFFGQIIVYIYQQALEKKTSSRHPQAPQALGLKRGTADYAIGLLF